MDASFGEQPGEFFAYFSVIDDPGGGDPQRRDAINVRFNFTGLCRRQPDGLQPILQPPLIERLKQWFLILTGGHDQLSANLMGNAVFAAEIHHRPFAFTAEARLQTSRTVVNS